MQHPFSRPPHPFNLLTVSEHKDSVTQLDSCEERRGLLPAEDSCLFSPPPLHPSISESAAVFLPLLLWSDRNSDASLILFSEQNRESFTPNFSHL